MFFNHLKIAWRNLARNRGFTLVNILGLTTGLVCFMLILLYIRDEMSYDQWHEKGDRICRVALERIYPGRSRFYAIIPPSYAESMEQDFSEVEASCRLFFFQGNNFLIKMGQETYEESNVMWSDSNFFDLFSIDLIKGDPHAVLVKPNSVVLTESAAEKYFGNEDPTGKVLDLAQTDNDLLVTGVCRDVPGNSHFKFDLLMSSSSLGFLQQPNFIGFSAYTYLLLQPGTSAAALEAKFPDHVVKFASGQILNQFGVNYEEYQKQGNGYRYFLQPLPSIYLDSNLESEMKPPGSRQRIYFFTVIAALILIIACINFMNLATARSANRAREVGIRKTLGSDRRQIAGQFFLEALLITLLSAALAAAVNYFVLPYFNGITGKSLSAADLFRWQFMLALLGAAAVTGLLSGAYPAFALSAFRPIEVLRGKFFQTPKGSALRNLLVIFQFGISVFLIISTILVYRQMAFTMNKSLGFDKESVISLQGAGGMTAQQEETLKKEIGRLPGVVAVSGCDTQPGGQYFGMSFKPQGADEMTTGSGLIVDEGYIECMKMEMLKGRSFDEHFMDTLSVVVNEAAVREMDLDDPVGKTLVSTDNFLNPVAGQQSVYTIIGVVRDFHFQSLHQVISPLFLVHHQRSFSPGVDNLITVRLSPSDFQHTLQSIEGIWKTFQPETPFRYAFLDQEWANLYEKEMTTRQVFGLFSMLAIFIACLGLLALAAFTAERRTKEIGIRKVLGATTGGIVGLLSRDFLKLVLAAILIASPFAWYAMDKWLQDFAYRIKIEWWVFVLAGAVSIAIAFLTVSFQSIRAALTNPVDSLKSD
ncbi:MAG TPA: ABC transporter permease [Flavilitoribacter sp.]|nr:ABC transporter permease [Flavilitoribacter sp.]